MSTKSLKDLSKKLGRKNRVDILEKLCMKSYRNRELSENLHIGKEKVSEALKDLVDSCLVILFEREAISSDEKHTIYVIAPIGSEILNISDKLDSIKEKFPEKITDFGEGIEYILKYYLEADFKVNHNARFIGEKLQIKMNIEKRTSCEKKNCEIYCKNLIENIVKRFGDIPQSYLFSWDEITGSNSGKLIDFLKSNYDVDWVKTAKITKTNNGKTITITTGKNVISLNLNNESTELNLEIDNGKTDKFIVKTEKGKLNIYNKQFKKVDHANCSFEIKLIRK